MRFSHIILYALCLFSPQYMSKVEPWCKACGEGELPSELQDLEDTIHHHQGLYEHITTAYSEVSRHIHTHTRAHACTHDQSKETVKDGLPNVLILCLLSFIVDEMNVSLLPLSSSPLLAFSCFLAYWAHLLPSDE